jgi:hypothetical protein
MMAQRHSGFAFVSGTTEGFVNSLIEAAFNNMRPIAFRLPSPIDAGAGPVSISGDVVVMPPHATFRRRPDNLVAVDCRFSAELRLEGLTPNPVDVVLDLRTSVLVGIAAPIVGDRFQVGLDLAQASVQILRVDVTEGFLGSAYSAVINSGPVLAALTAALRSVPSQLVRTTVDGIKTTTRIAPKQMPCGASLFELPEMFGADFTVSRIVPKVLDGELTIGVDIAGHSFGDANTLGTVFDGSAAVIWVRTNADNWRGHSALRKGNIGASVNPTVISSMINATLSAAARNAFLDCHVALDRIGVSLGNFTPELTTRLIDGANVTVGASFYPSPSRDSLSRLVPSGVSVGTEASFSFGLHLQTWDGDTAFLSRHADYWFIKVYNPSVDLPWWVTLGLIVVGVAEPLLLLPIIALLDGIIPSLLQNLAAGIERKLQSGIDGAVTETGLAAARTTRALPGLPGVKANWFTRLLSLSSQGMDCYVQCDLDNARDTQPDRALNVTVDGRRVRHGEEIHVPLESLELVRCGFSIAPGTVPTGDRTIRVSWEVRRTDTGEIVDQKDKQLFASDGVMLADPLAITINRTNPALMPVDEFPVRIRVYRPLYGRVKEFASCSFSVKVFDRFDRHHPFVKWFGWAQGGPRESVLHRTAVPGRCKMVIRAASDADIKYFDELPFPREEIVANRDGLCDYCFFGGPTRTTLLI